MSTNGHFSTEDTDRIMDEWYEIIGNIRAQLRDSIRTNSQTIAEWDKVTGNIRVELGDSILTDSQSKEECEFNIFVTVIIPSLFQFGGRGEAPNDIEESDKCYLWDYPRFSKIISQRALESKKTTKRFLEAAFEIKFQDRPDDSPIEALERILLFTSGRERMIKRVLGEDELLRVKSEKIFKDGIQKVTKKHSSDSLEDLEEEKSSAFTQSAS